MTDWFARPVLHVTDVATSVHFYVDCLGFTTAWRHEEEGKLIVAQVDRNGCALIFASNLSEKVGNDVQLLRLIALGGAKKRPTRCGASHFG